MATAVAAAAKVSAPAVQIPAEQRVVLYGVSWEGYEALLREVDARGARFTYDHGMLEIMTVSLGHEHFSKLLARFVEALTEELGIRLQSGRSTTLEEQAKKRGLEADECYWIKNAAKMRGKKEFNFASCPPPDLAIEVEVSRSMLNRLTIYADLGIPEIWRYDGNELTVYLLGREGEYAVCESSPTFPDMPLADLLRFLKEGDAVDETTLLLSFRKWVRKHVLPKWEGRKKKRSRTDARMPS